MSPTTGLPPASVTVAVAVVVDEPSAAMIGGDSETVTLVAGPSANAVGASSNAPSSTHTAPNARPTSRVPRITPAAVAAWRLLRNVPSRSIVNSSQSVRAECPGPSGEHRKQQSADWLGDLCHRADMPAVIDVELAYREPMDAEGVIAYLARRAIPGIEEVVDGAYRRSVRLPGGAGIIELAPATAGSGPDTCSTTEGSDRRRRALAASCSTSTPTRGPSSMPCRATR